ncbi:hypothetical protein FXO37_12370 [Capsicum annuum]|nr:hypothetical protein FXO37_12370 [Capsicum annuum]
MQLHQLVLRAKEGGRIFAVGRCCKIVSCSPFQGHNQEAEENHDLDAKLASKFDSEALFYNAEESHRLMQLLPSRGMLFATLCGEGL